MAYITYQQYLDLYGICPISEEEFPVYAGLASDMIDSITRYRIVEGGESPPSRLYFKRWFKRLPQHKCYTSHKSDWKPC